MEVDVMANLVGNIGFPIAVTLLLFKSLMDIDKAHNDTIRALNETHTKKEEAWQKAITNNTTVMHELVSELRVSREERRSIINDNESN